MRFNSFGQRSFPISQQKKLEDYYMAGRRPLDFPFGVGHLLYNSRISEPDDNDNFRGEHQHFIGSNGKNFGFNDGGEFEEQGRENEYAYDIPGIGTAKYKSKYMDMARIMVGEQMQDYSNRIRELMDSFSIENDEYSVNTYSMFFNNCQDYVDRVIETARELARRNGDTLEIR